jgi:hypothetical protein
LVRAEDSDEGPSGEKLISAVSAWKLRGELMKASTEMEADDDGDEEEQSRADEVAGEGSASKNSGRA